VLTVEVATPDELASVLEVLPRLRLKDVARVRVSCEDEIRRRVDALARAERIDVESAIIGAQPVRELEGVPGCMIGLAELDEDGDPVVEPTPVCAEHELRLVSLSDLDADTE
jgi:hypothetical protein